MAIDATISAATLRGCSLVGGMLLAVVAVVAFSASRIWPIWRVQNSIAKRRAGQRELAAASVEALTKFENACAAGDTISINAGLVALARTGDYRVAPVLIDALYYEDNAEVQIAAHHALCLLSRKPNGFETGPVDEMTPLEWLDEIVRWKRWYRSVRPESVFDDPIPVGLAGSSAQELGSRVSETLRDLRIDAEDYSR